jgi:hypothetical protein
MIREFVYWWRRQLISLLPPALLATLNRLETRSVLRPRADDGADPTAVVLLQGRVAHEAARGIFATDPAGLAALAAGVADPAGGAVLLELPTGSVLQKRLSVPRGMLPYLPTVLEPEIEHETPFLPDEVYWHAESLGPASGTDLVAVDLLLVGRDLVDPILGTLASAGIPVAGLKIGGSEAVIPLPRAGLRQSGLTPRLRQRVGALVALALLAAAIPFLRQSLEAQRTDARIQAVTADVEAVQSLRKALDGTSVASPNRIAPIDLLATITDILPDDTELTGLAVERREVSVTGRSSAANALLPRFVAAGYRDASFSAPVVRDSVGDRDVFSIHFSLAGGR